jgi:hypothetical protein
MLYLHMAMQFMYLFYVSIHRRAPNRRESILNDWNDIDE